MKIYLEAVACNSTGEDGASVDVVPAPFDGAEQRGIYEVRGPGRHVTAQAA